MKKGGGEAADPSVGKILVLCVLAILTAACPQPWSILPALGTCWILYHIVKRDLDIAAATTLTSPQPPTATSWTLDSPRD